MAKELQGSVEQRWNRAVDSCDVERALSCGNDTRVQDCDGCGTVQSMTGNTFR